MRSIILNIPARNVDDSARLARLTRHLNARLLDFGPGGPEVVNMDEESGLIQARFPGHKTSTIIHALAKKCGVHIASEDEHALFCLQENTRFEDLDYVWGCLFDLLV